MDMLPPQAPPAIISSQNQETRDTAQRLVEAQDWLIEQNGLLPRLPDIPTTEGLRFFLDELTAFWRAPVAMGPGRTDLPRSAVFADRLASVMNDEATLRHLDGTLSTRASNLATTFARSHGHALSPHIQTRELVFGDVAYAGAVVVVDDRIDDMALLFSPARGWEEFASLDALYEGTEHRTRRSMAADDVLPGIMDDDLDNVVNQAFVTSRLIEGNAFDQLVDRIMEVQEERAAAAWIDIDADTDAPPAPDGATGDLAAGLAYDMSLHHYLDVRSIVMARNARLQEAIVDEQLARMPEEAQNAWRQARSDYASEQQMADDTFREFGIGNVTSLEDFALGLLKTMLAGKGVDSDPRRIAVDVYPMPVNPVDQALNPVPAAGLALTSPSADTRLESTSLLDLALRNVSPLEGKNLRARDGDGKDLVDLLSPRDLPGIIRDLDVAARYRDYLREALDSSPEGQLRRVVSTALRHKRMRLELEDARLGDHQPEAARSFRLDRNQRGYEWVRAVLDAPDPSTRAKVEGHAIVVRQLLYKGEPVKDVLIIAAAQPQAVSNIVLYTPDAPDGRAFREFRDGAQADAEFFYNTAFEQYFIDRLPMDVSEPLPNGASRRFKVSHGDALSQWVFSQRNRTGTRTAEPFDERIVAGNVLDALHETALSLMSRNLSSLARSTQEANADSVPRLDVEAVGRSISWFVGRPFQGAWRAYDGVKAGDYARAFVDGAQAYVASLDYLGAGPLVSRVALPMIGRVGRQSGQLVSLGNRLRSPDVLQEPRFVAKDVNPNNATSLDDGIYTIGGAQYVAQGDRMYGVRFDGQSGTWRLRRPGTGPASYGPPIMRDASGTWVRDTKFGLLGGLDRPARRALLNEPEGRILSPWQLHVAGHTLIRQVGTAETIVIAAILRDRGRAGLSPVQLRALVRALARGRAAPTLRPVPLEVAPPVHPQPGSSQTAQAPAPVSPVVPASHLPTEPLDLRVRRPVHRNVPDEPLDLSLARVEELSPDQWPDVLWHRPAVPRYQTDGGLAMDHIRLPYAPYLGFRAQATEPPGLLPVAASGPRSHPGPPMPWVQLDMRRMRRPLYGLRVSRITEPGGGVFYAVGYERWDRTLRLLPGDFVLRR